MEERGVDEIPVLGAEVDVPRAGPAGPDRVGMSVDDTLGLRGRAGGEHDAVRQQRVRVASGPVVHLSEQPLERREPLVAQAGRLLTRLRFRHGHPFDGRTDCGNDLGVAGLGDRGHALCLLGEPGHLFGHRLGVRGDADRSHGGARQPSQEQLW